MKETIFKTLNEYKKVLEDKGYTVLYMGLYGSQNYNVSDELSDIDCKAIVLPSLSDIIFRKTTSTVYETPTGTIDTKDLITFYDVIKKGNFSYIESIDTEYSIGDKEIKEMFKGTNVNLKSILGAMYEKRKALTHEFPSKRMEFEKWGFDPKQLHHIIRLSDLLHDIKYGNENKSYLTYTDEEREEKVDIKRNKCNIKKDYAERLADVTIENSKEYIPNDYLFIPTNINKEINDYIEKKIKVQLMSDSKTISARQYRTFGTPVPKKDLEKFQSVLEPLDGQDISYIVYESIEIL